MNHSNILHDEEDHPVICDFVFSKMIFIEAFQEPRKIRTQFYMSPEIHEHKEYGNFFDVYAFLIIFFKILTGDSPFDTNVDTAIFISTICEGRRSALSKYGKEFLADEMKTLISRCWNLYSSKRPTFSEIIKIIEKIQFEENE